MNVFPAQAGVILAVSICGSLMHGLSRVSGGDPIITLAYGKKYDGAVNYDWYLKNIRENRLLYVNRKKANRLLGPAGVRFSLGPKANGFFDSNIKTEENLVKLKNANPTLADCIMNLHTKNP